MGLTWGDDPITTPRRPEHAATQRLMEALDPRCRRLDQYETRADAVEAICHEQSLWRRLAWRPWQCGRIGCDSFHIGPKGNRAR